MLGVDGKPNLPTQGMNLGQTANALKYIVRRETKITDTMRFMLSNWRAFQKDHVVRFVNMVDMNIVEDLVFSIFLSVNCKATFIR